MEQVYLLTRAMAVGVLMMVCLKLWLDYRKLTAGRLLLLLFIGIAAYLLRPFFTDNLLLVYSLSVLATLIPPVFYLFTTSVFHDWDKQGRGVGLYALAAIGLYLLLVYGSYFLKNSDLINLHSWLGRFTDFLYYASYAFRLVFVGLAFAAVISQWSQDLVESRRRLRTAMVVVGGLHMAVVIVVEVILKGQDAPMWLEVLHSVILLGLMLVLAGWLLIIAPDGFLNTLGVPGKKALSQTSPSQQPQAGKALNQTEENWLANLKQAMKDKIYHDSQLSITALAQRLSIPEHILRRLINQHLDYRNFNEFLNQYRLDDACDYLSNHTHERLPILSIALEVGYGSLTPFNKVFKARHGQTPSEYRREHLSRP